MKNQLLNVEVVDEVLTISIGVEALKTSLESGRLDRSCAGEFTVTDLEAFTCDLLDELRIEEADGSTAIDLMLDAAALRSFEGGGAGCEVEDPVKARSQYPQT